MMLCKHWRVNWLARYSASVFKVALHLHTPTHTQKKKLKCDKVKSNVLDAHLPYSTITLIQRAQFIQQFSQRTQMLGTYVMRS